MKKNVIFLICLILFSVVFMQSNAQDLKNNNDVNSPKFKGGEEVSAVLEANNSAMINNYLCENIECPNLAAVCQKEGTEIVQFTVTQSGNVEDFKVINSVCPELDMEVIRVLKTTNGMWKPAFKDGKAIAMKKEVEFLFGVHNQTTIQNYFTKVATRCYKNGSKDLIIKNNPKTALRHFNTGINYMPNDKALLSIRGLCLYELGDKKSARRDWNRIIALGGIDERTINNGLIGMKGYTEMTKLLAYAKDN